MTKAAAEKKTAKKKTPEKKTAKKKTPEKKTAKKVIAEPETEEKTPAEKGAQTAADAVDKKNTTELMRDILDSETLEAYLDVNPDILPERDTPQMLRMLLKERKVKKAVVIRRAELNEIYCYQIFRGERMPSRDKLICLGIGFELSVPLMQKLLKLSGYSPLYPRIIRDCVILLGIREGLSPSQINTKLIEKKQLPLF